MSIDVHWHLLRRSVVPSDRSWLTAAEQETLAGLTLAKRRGEWLAGRWTAKRALARMLGLPVADLPRLEIVPDDEGAPTARLDGELAELTLSLSHRDDRALVMITRAQSALGCDIERVESRTERFIQDYFTSEEVGAIPQGPEPLRALGAALTWSAKESTLKALRTGLRRDTRSVEVHFHPADLLLDETPRWRPLSVRDTKSDLVFDGWWRHVEGHVLTVTARPAPAEPQHILR